MKSTFFMGVEVAVKQQLLNQSTGHLFIHYVSLSMLAMLGQSLFIFADTFFIANGVGPAGIAALNIVLPMISVFSGLGWMLGVGGSTMYAMAKGSGDRMAGQSYFKLTVLLSIVISLIYTALALLFADPILRFLGANAAIFQMSQDYYLIIMAFAPLFMLNYVLISFVRNANQPRLAMVALLSGGLTNIVLDYLFIFPLAWGLPGAALATITSPLVSLAVIGYHTKGHLKELMRCKFEWETDSVKSVLSLGFPLFLNEFSSALVMFAFNRILVIMVGNMGVAAYGIIANMNIIAIALFTGIGQGFQPLASQYFGARQNKQLLLVLKYALLTALAIGVAMTALGLLVPQYIVAIFNGEQNRALAQIAVPGVMLYFTSYLFTGVNFTAIFYTAAVGDARPSFFISILRGVVLIIPTLLLMAKLLNINGIWLTMAMVEVLTALLSIYVLKVYFKAKSS